MTPDARFRWRLLSTALFIAVVAVGYALALSYLARGGVR